MKLKNSLASAAIAASLLVSPIAAQAAASDRASTAVSGEELRGGSPALYIGLVAVFGVIAWLIGDSDNPEDVDTPASP